MRSQSVQRRSHSSQLQLRRLFGAVSWLWKPLAPTWPAIAALGVLVFTLLILRRYYVSFDPIQQGVYIEAWGTVFDIVVVGIILSLFANWRERKERVERYLEEIDDFKKWDCEEARLRIAGNIRRLAKLGVTNMDLSGIVLRNFRFGAQDIESLKGAQFNQGLRLDRMSKNASQLEEVDFMFVNCSGTVFSRSFAKSAGLGLVGKNLNFVGTNLSHACFEGAKLSWTDYKSNPGDWFSDEGEDPEGNPVRLQTHYPAFANANLDGCSFRYAELDHADFRDAENILHADFTGVTGLQSCFFDDGVRPTLLAATTDPSAK
jgi:uncharacterized protein YjbI with pentapeptide repeats